MNTPSDAIPSILTDEDVRLKSYVSLLDYAYSKARKALLILPDLVKTSTTPDYLLNHLLYSKGVPLYWKYTNSQKRSLLEFREVEFTAELVGNSGATVYSGTLLNPPIVRDSVTFSANSGTFVDDNLGRITGTGLNSGWVNYNTGQYFLEFTSATSTNVTCDYTQFYRREVTRYTAEGLRDFIDRLISTKVYYVGQYYSKKQQMFFDFGLYGFPNSYMRNTAGQESGDMIGYFYNSDTLSNLSSSNDVIIYQSSALTTNEFNLLKSVLKFEITSIDFNQVNTLYVYESSAGTVNITYDAPDYIITGSGFTTDFTGDGDRYIGIVQGGPELVTTYKIKTIDSATQITLDSNQDVTTGTGQTYYKPVLTQIGIIE
jgi:hypothetical protein